MRATTLLVSVSRPEGQHGQVQVLLDRTAREEIRGEVKEARGFLQGPD